MEKSLRWPFISFGTGAFYGDICILLTWSASIYTWTDNTTVEKRSGRNGDHTLDRPLISQDVSEHGGFTNNSLLGGDSEQYTAHARTVGKPHD